MKVLTGLIISAVLLVGCVDKKADSKRDERIAIMQSNIMWLKQKNSDSAAIIGDVLTVIQKQNALIKETAATNRTIMYDLMAEVLNSEVKNDAAIQSHQSQESPYHSTDGSSSLSAGVPSEVYSRMKAHAEHMWPDNYDMQAFDVQQQITAYQKLH